MGTFDRLVAEYRATHGVKHAEAVRAVRALAADREGTRPPTPSTPPAVAPLERQVPPPGPGQLGELRFEGHWVKQRVLTDGRFEISYALAPDGGYLGPLVGGSGFGGIPEWIPDAARRYAQQHEERLLRMVQATQHGPFKADRGGISATINTGVAVVSVWFTRWNDERPIIRNAPNIDHDTARQIAVERFLEVPASVRKRLHLIARPQDKLLDREKNFVIECLGRESTWNDQTLAQLHSFTAQAGLTDTSLEDIGVAAQLLAFERKVTQKSGANSDCFWLTEEQLRALGGMKEPAWAVPHVLIREVHPGPNRQPEHTLPASPDTPCTPAPEGTDASDAMTLDHLTPRGDGLLYAYDADSEPWPGAIVTLADCQVGDLVYLNRSNWVASPAYWTLYEVVSPDAN